MGEFNSDDHYIYSCGQESFRRNGVTLRVNKRVQNVVLGCDLKNDRMISVHFQGKPFSITVIQVFAPTTDAKEAEVEWFYGDLQDLLVQLNSVQSLSHVQLFATPWIAACQASLSIINSWSLLKLIYKSVMPSSHLIFCCPLLLLPPIPPRIRVFSNKSTLHIRWPKYWSFSFSISPSNEYPGLISFRMDWLEFKGL